MNRPLLVVDDLVTWLRTPSGPVRAVDGVSFELEAGRVLGVVGESGSGKTMLGRSIMGLLPRAPIDQLSGSVWFDGHDLRALPRSAVRARWGRSISMVFQDPMASLNPVMTIGRQIGEPLRRHLGLNRVDAERRAITLLEQVRVPDARLRVHEYPHQLSGGLRQRVMCAIALACGPELLIADEPTTALDVTVQAQIMDLLDRLREEFGMAIILITHDMGVVANRADDLLVMYGGRIVESGPTWTVLDNPMMPYTYGLLKSIPRLTDPTGTRLHVIPGHPPSLVAPPVGCRFEPRCDRAIPACASIEPVLTRVDETRRAFACWNPIADDRITTPVSLGRCEGPSDREARRGG